MPEGPEVTILGQYLLTKLEGRMIEKLEIISGKYLKKGMKNSELFDGTKSYIVKNIESKGKLMWFTLEDNNKEIYISSHLGLSGFWRFTEKQNDRLRFSVKDPSSQKTYKLCFEDDRNFGNIEIYTDKKKLQEKIDDLAPDALKSDYTIDDFVEMYKTFLKNQKKEKSENEGTDVQLPIYNDN